VIACGIPQGRQPVVLHTSCFESEVHVGATVLVQARPALPFPQGL
jgi:hypothetical protein